MVCSYLTREGKLTFSSLRWCSKQKLVLLLKSKTSCRQPLSVTLPSSPPLAVTPPLLYKSPPPYLYLISYKSTLIWLRFYIDVCPLKSNCHACIFCVPYGVGTIYYFIWKIRLYEVQKGALSSCGYVFFYFYCLIYLPCVWESVCVRMPNMKLHIFKAF